jgi:hypothetical protein
VIEQLGRENPIRRDETKKIDKIKKNIFSISFIRLNRKFHKKMSSFLFLAAFIFINQTKLESVNSTEIIKNILINNSPLEELFSSEFN